MYAIIRDRGTQYRVEPGETLNIALMDAAPGSELELGEVLLIGGDQVRVGAPTVVGARVRAQVIGTQAGDKLVIFHYQNKKRRRVRTGHRQDYTRIKISEILL